MNNTPLFKTNDLNLAAYLETLYPLVKYARNDNGRFIFFFTDSPILRQRVFEFFSRQAQSNLADFCDNQRRLKALLSNL